MRRTVIPNSPLFRKLLSSAFLLIAATLLTLYFYLTGYIAERETQQVEERLTSEARILAGEVPVAAPAVLETWAKDVALRAEARVTIVDPKGLVLADSEHDPETMENHAERPEIRDAYLGRVGRSIRRSATLDRDLCYVAFPLRYGSQSGYVLRLAVPLQALDAAVVSVRWRIFLASLVALGIALVLAYFFSATFTYRIRRLQSFAENLLNERRPDNPLPDATDELGALARSLSKMADQLRRTVERLSVESARREAILSSMVEGVLAVDQEMRVTFCNESFTRAVGAVVPALKRPPLLELVRDPELFHMLNRVLVSGEPVKQRLEVPAAGGRSFEVQAAPLATSSGRGAIAILHDITDLERLERVRKDFVANVSHELRTPLAAIQGYTETLLDGAIEDPEHNRKFLEIIKSHSNRLNNIASDLLVLSELESGRPDASEPELLSVRKVLDAALRAVETEASIRGVDLLYDRVEDAPVRGHRMRLEQALLNLLTNAVKFNRPGGEVRVGAGRTAEGQVRITVADTGIGIPSEDLSRIFERFYRVDKARSREVGGTGLGLSIVKHVVERMRGRVTVESELGKGTSFTVVLPACDPAAADVGQI